MRYLLVGNGINIQFDNSNYTTQQIVLRILKNCDRDDFPAHIIVNFPYLMKNYLGLLFLEARKMIVGEYDEFTIGTSEKTSLKVFKEHYKKNISILKITDIGFEDYYLIHDLVCHKNETHNPDQFTIREAMKMAYLYSVYNEGKLNKLHLKYSKKFVEYLSHFDSIFTTNYDSNIESVSETQTYHIHGQFNKISEVYNETSFRNQLPDAPIKEITIDETHYYLYSNALSTHCGAYKEFQLNQYSQANDVVEKMATAYKSDVKIRTDVDSWTKDKNTLTANLGYAIQLKAENPDLCFKDDYHFEKLKKINGSIEILGLSPWNDFHIFEAIDNANIQECVYYFYNADECETVKSILPTLWINNKLRFLSVKEFWGNYNESKDKIYIKKTDGKLD